MYRLVLQPGNKVQALVNMKLLFVVSKESVTLVSSMVLGAETPIYIGEDRLAFKVFCSEDTAAYAFSLLTAEWGCSENGSLSIFSTYLAQKHGFFNILGFKVDECSKHLLFKNSGCC